MLKKVIGVISLFIYSGVIDIMSEFEQNIKKYNQMMKSGELDQFKGHYGAFQNGNFLYTEKTRDDLIKKLNDDNYLKDEVMIQEIGAEPLVIKFRRPRRFTNTHLSPTTKK